MEKTIKFWTESEIKIAKKALESTPNVAKAAIYVAARLGRPLSGTYAKMYNIKRSFSPLQKQNNKISKGVVLPKGFSFEINPTKVIMHPDRRIELFY